MNEHIDFQSAVYLMNVNTRIMLIVAISSKTDLKLLIERGAGCLKIRLLKNEKRPNNLVQTE